MTMRRNAQVLALVGSGHAVSHLYLLALPPLFPLLREDLDASYAALGLLVAVFNVATGMAQIPAGFLVDRFGGRRLLLLGLTVMGGAITALGFAPSYGLMLALVALAGIGNSVFHPADYAILTASVDRGWLGRAFGIHTFAGNVGFVLAPATMVALTALLGWRGALSAAGLIAFMVLGAMLFWGELLQDEARGAGEGRARHERSPAGVRLLLSGPVLLLFLFYVLAAMFTSGVHSFSVTALNRLWGTDLGLANVILSAFLTASALGILLGGLIADHTRRYALLTVAVFGAAATLTLTVGLVPLPTLAVGLLFIAIGLLQGSARTSRDMLVRRVTPPGATGRVFAFVMTGLNVGAAITPVLFGLLLDRGEPRALFLLLAGFLVAAAAVVLLAQAATAASEAKTRPEKLAAE
jgi:MFS family permease